MVPERYGRDGQMDGQTTYFIALHGKKQLRLCALTCLFSWICTHL